MPRHPSHEFAEGGMDGDTVEMDNRGVRFMGAVAMLPVGLQVPEVGS